MLALFYFESIEFQQLERNNLHENRNFVENILRHVQPADHCLSTDLNLLLRNVIFIIWYINFICIYFEMIWLIHIIFFLQLTVYFHTNIIYNIGDCNYIKFFYIFEYLCTKLIAFLYLKKKKNTKCAESTCHIKLRWADQSYTNILEDLIYILFLVEICLYNIYIYIHIFIFRYDWKRISFTKFVIFLPCSWCSTYVVFQIVVTVFW